MRPVFTSPRPVFSAEAARQRRSRGPRRGALGVSIALLATLSLVSPGTAAGGRGHVHPADFTTSATSEVRAGVEATPKDPKVVTRNSLVVPSFTRSISGQHGHATTSVRAKTEVTQLTDSAVIETGGTLDSSATCSTKTCPGNLETAAVWAFADAAIHVTIQDDQGSHTQVPYSLTATLHANGQSGAPCGSVTVTLSGSSQAEDLEVLGPIAPDPGCRREGPGAFPGRSLKVLREGFVMTDGSNRIHLDIAADTDFIDPGTKRTDRLHADWDVALVLGPASDLSVLDGGGYDPTKGREQWHFSG